jgi:hypothetical protein
LFEANSRGAGRRRSIGVAIATFTLPQWISLAELLLQAEPAVAKIIADLHAAFAVIRRAILTP